LLWIGAIELVVLADEQSCPDRGAGIDTLDTMMSEDSLAT
jgi:hypothetical protein